MAQAADRTYYEILGVAPDATAEEIQAAYWCLAKPVHPDHGGSAAIFQFVNDAYRTLSDPISRRAYDATLGISGSHQRQESQSTETRPGGPRPADQPETGQPHHPDGLRLLADRPAEFLLGLGLILLIAPLPPGTIGYLGVC